MKSITDPASALHEYIELVGKVISETSSRLDCLESAVANLNARLDLLQPQPASRDCGLPPVSASASTTPPRPQPSLCPHCGSLLNKHTPVLCPECGKPTKCFVLDFSKAE